MPHVCVAVKLTCDDDLRLRVWVERGSERLDSPTPNSVQLCDFTSCQGALCSVSQPTTTFDIALHCCYSLLKNYKMFVHKACSLRIDASVSTADLQ
jgi:hypothetical protein